MNVHYKGQTITIFLENDTYRHFKYSNSNTVNPHDIVLNDIRMFKRNVNHMILVFFFFFSNWQIPVGMHIQLHIDREKVPKYIYQAVNDVYLQIV